MAGALIMDIKLYGGVFFNVKDTVPFALPPAVTVGYVAVWIVFPAHVHVVGTYVPFTWTCALTLWVGFKPTPTSTNFISNHFKFEKNDSLCNS
jgi:hypothetical protein